MIKRPLVLWLLMGIAMILSIFIKAITGGLVVIGLFFVGGFLVWKFSGKTYIYKGHRLEVYINNYDKVFYIIGIFLMLILGIKSYNSIYNHPNHDENNNQTIKISGIITKKQINENSVEYILETKDGEVVQVYEYFEENDIEAGLKDNSSEDEKNDANVLSLGTTVIVHGKKKNYEKGTNPGQFDEYNYYRLVKGYCYRVNAVSIKEGDDYEDAATSGKIGNSWVTEKTSETKMGILSGIVQKYNGWVYGLKEGLFDFRVKLMNQAAKVFNEKDGGLVKAMVLGEKNAADEELKELYTDSGIIHLMVISGTHISLLSMIVYNLLKKKMKVVYSACISMIVTILYVAITGFTVSSNRAVIMLVLFLAAKIILRTYDMKSAIGLSGLIIMFNNPLSIISSGFILSFLAVVAIAYPFEKCVEIINEDVKKRRKKGEESGWGKYEFLVENIKKSFILSGLINVVTLPVVLYTYFKYPVYSIVINVIVAPFMPYIIVISILAILFSYIWLPLGQFLAGSVHFILLLYEKVCKVTSNLPFSEIRTGRPGIGQMVLYYIVILILFFAMKWILNKFKAIYLKSNIIILCVVAFILCGCIMLRNNETNESFVRMLDVGQGDCFFINSDNGTSCLMDGGSTSNLNVGGQIIEKYLMSVNVWELDYVFISHFDSDHISGIIQLIENDKIKIKNIVIPDIENTNAMLSYMDMDENIRNFSNDKNGDFNNDINKYENYMNVLESSGAKINYAREGMIIDKGSLKMLCLNPTVDVNYMDSNSMSACYYLKNGDMSYLFTGDVCDEGEENLVNNLAKYNIKQVDVLKVAHHGSRSSTSIEMLELIKPKVALISCGKDNSYNHPHEEVIEMLEKIRCDIVITAKDGSWKSKEGGG